MRRKEVKLDSGAIMVLGVAPEVGTKLTAKRLLDNLDSLNKKWRKDKNARFIVVDGETRFLIEVTKLEEGSEG